MCSVIGPYITHQYELLVLSKLYQLQAAVLCETSLCSLAVIQQKAEYITNLAKMQCYIC